MTATPYRSEVTLEGDSIVRVKRKFHAPRALVWKAYTDPALVQRWQLGPPGWSMPVCEMDVRVGGSFRWWYKEDEGDQEFGFHGEYLKVEKPSRLMTTEHFDDGNTGEFMGEATLVTVTFTESDGVTTVVTEMDFHTAEAREGALATGMTDGMELSYQLLDTLLDETKS